MKLTVMKEKTALSKLTRFVKDVNMGWVEIFSLKKGVKDVKIDIEKKTISIAYDSTKTTAEKLKKYIVSIGFDTDQQKADKSKREILRDCCFSDITICK